MANEIQGCVVYVGQVYEGVSQSGKPYQRQTVVVEHGSVMWPRKAVFEIKNEKIPEFHFHIGDKGLFQFDLDGREANGRWWPSVTCYGFKASDQARVNPGEPDDMNLDKK